MEKKILINYKKTALKLLKNEDFKAAKLFFSLAYEKRKNKRLLIFIELCDLGLEQPFLASLLTAFYIDNYTHKKVDEDVKALIDKANAQNCSNFLDFSYKDFCSSEDRVGFKGALTNIIFSTKLIIDDRDEFLDFLAKLLENGHFEMVLSYLEHLHPYFSFNHKFLQFCKKIRKYHENQLKK